VHCSDGVGPLRRRYEKKKRSTPRGEEKKPYLLCMKGSLPFFSPHSGGTVRSNYRKKKEMHYAFHEGKKEAAPTRSTLKDHRESEEKFAPSSPSQMRIKSVYLIA